MGYLHMEVSGVALDVAAVGTGQLQLVGGEALHLLAVHAFVREADRQKKEQQDEGVWAGHGFKL